MKREVGYLGLVESVGMASKAKYRVVETSPNKDVELGDGQASRSDGVEDKKNVWIHNDENSPCIARITPCVPVEGAHVLVYGTSRGHKVAFPRHCLLGPGKE